MNNLFRTMFAALLLLGISFSVDVTDCITIDYPGHYDVVKTLTSSTTDCIWVRTENVSIDCHGNYVQSTSPGGYAIHVVEGWHNVLIENCVVGGSWVGIHAGGPHSDTLNLTIRNVEAQRNNFAGIELVHVTHSTISDNSFYQNTQYGLHCYGCDYDTVIRNSALENGNAGFNFAGISHSTIDSNLASVNSGSGFNFFGSHKNTITRNAAANGQFGYLFSDSHLNTIERNGGAGNGYSFALIDGSSLNTLSSNTAYGDIAGFYAYQALNNTFAGNSVWDSDIGIYVTQSGPGNTLDSNTIRDNKKGIVVSYSDNTLISGNILTNNGVLGSDAGIDVLFSDGCSVNGNSVTGSPHSIKIDQSTNTVVNDNTVNGPSYYSLIISGSPGTTVLHFSAVNAGPIMLRGDEAGNTLSYVTLRSGSSQATFSTHLYSGEIDINAASAPAAAPSGYSQLNTYLTITPMGSFGGLMLMMQYTDAMLSGLNESNVTAFVYGSGWAQPSQSLNTADNFVYMPLVGEGTAGLFSTTVPTPPTPPVTPPSGGGSSGGGTTHGGSGSGAPHIGIPYVPSGSGGTTVEVEPQCTSDSDCATSATCSGGVCRALEAGGSCGAFANHEWVDYECCGGEDCGAGEVCKNNECVSMEPLDITGTEPQSSGTEASGSDQGLGRLLADIPWWVLLILVLMVGGGIYARYRMGGEQPPDGEAPSEEEMPPAEPEEE